MIADNHIATLTNEIYSIIYAVAVIAKDSLIDLLEHFTEITDIEDLENIFNIVFVPLLIVNSIATLFCLLKGYWIEKYKNKENEK